MYFVMMNDIEYDDGQTVSHGDILTHEQLNALCTDDIDVKAFGTYQAAKAYVDWSRV